MLSGASHPQKGKLRDTGHPGARPGRRARSSVLGASTWRLRAPSVLGWHSSWAPPAVFSWVTGGSREALAPHHPRGRALVGDEGRAARLWPTTTSVCWACQPRAHCSGDRPSPARAALSGADPHPQAVSWILCREPVAEHRNLGLALRAHGASSWAELLGREASAGELPAASEACPAQGAPPGADWGAAHGSPHSRDVALLAASPSPSGQADAAP